MNETEWKKVITAADCAPCADCGEPICPVCQWHYADCACPGPMQEDEFIYRVKNGQLWAKSRRAFFDGTGEAP